MAYRTLEQLVCQDESAREGPKCYNLLRQMLSALDFLHNNKIAHLDVKTANIFVKNGLFKLGDFGLATRIDAAITDGPPEGDARYMPPELLDFLGEGDKIDLRKCDVFSLGISVFEV